MELVIFSALEGLQQGLESYSDISILAPSKIEQVQRLINSDQPPQALYLDDTRPGVPINDIWRLLTAAQQQGVAVYLNTQGSALTLKSDAEEAGVPVITARQSEEVVAWLVAGLGVSRRQNNARVPLIAIGAAKGGIGKTLVTTQLAEALRRRGLRVLVWDADVSNPGVVPVFRVPSSAPSYIHLIKRGAAHWNPTGIAPFVHQPEHTRITPAGWGPIDVFIGSHMVAKAENDMRLPEFQGLAAAVGQLDTYDIVLVDTSPDYLKRPYLVHILMTGGYAILPTPSGRRERLGVGNMLDHIFAHAAGRMEACFLLFMEPERGVTVTIRDIIPQFARRYPQTRALGTLPRSPRLASLADEHDGYRSMLDIAPASPFARAMHGMADSLCRQLGLTPPLPALKVGRWTALKARLRGDRINVPPPNTSLGALQAHEG